MVIISILEAVFYMAKDFNFLFIYIPLGPGNNYFDKNFAFPESLFIVFGLGWDVNSK